jgi:serine/threonine protein kinase
MNKDHLFELSVMQQMIMCEIVIMHWVCHPHVVHIHEVMATKKSIFIIMEFVGGGSLDAYLIHCNDCGISEASVHWVF